MYFLITMNAMVPTTPTAAIDAKSGIVQLLDSEEMETGLTKLTKLFPTAFGFTAILAVQLQARPSLQGNEVERPWAQTLQRASVTNGKKRVELTEAQPWKAVLRPSRETSLISHEQPLVGVGLQHEVEAAAGFEEGVGCLAAVIEQVFFRGAPSGEKAVTGDAE